VADVTAYYVDQVIIKGCAFLSTHRFFFLAYLHKEDTLPAAKTSQDDNVRAGPGIFHRPVRCVKRKVWFELKKEMLAGYPSSEHLYEPYGNVRIHHIENIEDLKDDGREVHFTIRGERCWMEFDTKEAWVTTIV
jgi:hypothetical protein